MKELRKHFEARAAKSYRPPVWVRVVGHPLEPEDACPTLFRYPCPKGLRDFQAGGLQRLAGGGYSKPVFLADTIDAIDIEGPAHFGCLVLLQPLRYHPCRFYDPNRPHHWIASNTPIEGDPAIAWLPPQLAPEIQNWDDIASPAEIVEQIGHRRFDEAARETWESLSNYLEEISSMAIAGAPGPRGPWCAVPQDERRQLLERFSVRPQWTL